MRPVGKPPRPVVEKGPSRRPGLDYRADPDSDDELEVVEVEPDTPAPTGERRPSNVGLQVTVADTLRPPDTFPSQEPDTTSRILATTTAAEEAEAARAAEEMRRVRFNWRWLFETKKGQFVLKLAATFAAGGGWTQAREPVLAFIGVESSEVAKAREDRQAKQVADLEMTVTDLRIKLAEFEKRADRLKTTVLSQEADVAELKKKLPSVEGRKPE